MLCSGGSRHRCKIKSLVISVARPLAVWYYRLLLAAVFSPVKAECDTFLQKKVTDTTETCLYWHIQKWRYRAFVSKVSLQLPATSFIVALAADFVQREAVSHCIEGLSLTKDTTAETQHLSAGIHLGENELPSDQGNLKVIQRNRRWGSFQNSIFSDCQLYRSYSLNRKRETKQDVIL